MASLIVTYVHPNHKHQGCRHSHEHPCRREQVTTHKKTPLGQTRSAEVTHVHYIWWCEKVQNYILTYILLTGCSLNAYTILTLAMFAFLPVGSWRKECQIVSPNLPSQRAVYIKILLCEYISFSVNSVALCPQCICPIFVVSIPATSEHFTTIYAF